MSTESLLIDFMLNFTIPIDVDRKLSSGFSALTLISSIDIDFSYKSMLKIPLL